MAIRFKLPTSSHLLQDRDQCPRPRLLLHRQFRHTAQRRLIGLAGEVPSPRCPSPFWVIQFCIVPKDS